MDVVEQKHLKFTSGLECKKTAKWICSVLAFDDVELAHDELEASVAQLQLVGDEMDVHVRVMAFRTRT